MFSHLTINELAVIALLLDEEQKYEDERKTLHERIIQTTVCENNTRKRKKAGETDVPDKEKKPRRFGIRENLKNRKQLGEYYTLFPQLCDNEEKFLEYFKVSQNQFHTILGKIKQSIKKENTIFKEALRPGEKLAVCLR